MIKKWKRRSHDGQEKSIENTIARLIKTLTSTRKSYVAFVYTQKRMQNVKQSWCCKEFNASAFTVDNTFNLRDIWITDTFHRIKRQINSDTKNTLSFLDLL